MHLKWPRCGNCGSLQHPAAYMCSACLESDLHLEPISPAGKILSWTKLHTSTEPFFQSLLPWTVVSIQLEAGPIVIAHWAGEKDPLSGSSTIVAAVEDPLGRNVFAAISTSEDYTLAKHVFERG